MDRYSLFSFDVGSLWQRGTQKQIEIPLLQRDKDIDSKNRCVNQIMCISDNSRIQIQAQLTNYQKICSFIQKYIPIISPQSIFLLFWNLLNSLAILYNFIEVPIVIFITSTQQIAHEQKQIGMLVDIFLLTIFLIDLLFIRFRITYFQSQFLIMNYEVLIKNYLQLRFIVDLIAFLVYLFAVIYGGFAIYFKVIFYIKIYTLQQINDQMENKLLFNQYILALYKFIRMVCFIFIVTSLSACIYFAVDYSYYLQKGFNYDNGYLWLTGSATTDEMNLITTFHWQVWYDYALYWAVQTTSAVGYGNITPRNPFQVFFCNMVMLFTLCLFVFFAGTIIDILEQLQQSNLRKQKKLTEMNHFTSIHQIQRKTRKNIQFFIQCLMQSHTDENEAFLQQILSQKLHKQFTLSFKSQIFSNMSILNIITRNIDDSNNSFARSVIPLMQVSYFSTGDYVCHQHVTDPALFRLAIIVRGKVTMFNKVTDYEKDYRSWDYFGQREFFFGGITLCKIICKTFTKFYYFEKIPFFQRLKEYPEFYQKCMEQVHLSAFNRKSTTDFDVNCYNCDDNHLLQHCPVNILWRDRLPKIKHRYQSDKDHSRCHHQRTKLNSFKIHNNYLKQCNQYDQILNSKNYFPFQNI